MKGFLTLKRIVDSEGKPVPLQKAVDCGWIKPYSGSCLGFDIGRDEIPLGPNLWVDSGRQAMAYAFGLRSPITNYVVQKFGVGTGTATPNVSDTTLQNPILLTGGNTKAINGVDWPSPMVARVEFTIASGEANGYLITELGLFTGDDTLICRKGHAGINKTSDYEPTLQWKVRF
jgi:hypothetical protein